MGTDAEEFHAAWTATVGRQSEESLDGCQDTRRHAVGCDALQIQVTAARAMSVVRESGGHSASIKAKTAGIASPGLQSDKPTENVDCATAT